MIVIGMIYCVTLTISLIYQTQYEQYNTDSTIFILLIAAQVLFMALLKYSQKRKYIALNALYVIQCASNIQLLTYYKDYLEDNPIQGVKNPQFCFGVYLTLVLMLMMHLEIFWITRSLVLIFFVNFAIIINSGLNMLSYLPVIELILICFGILYYYQELQLKKIFYTENQQRKQVINQQMLIKEYLPVSVMVVHSYQQKHNPETILKVDFTNTSWSNQFKSKRKNQIETLSKIILPCDQVTQFFRQFAFQQSQIQEIIDLNQNTLYAIIQHIFDLNKTEFTATHIWPTNQSTQQAKPSSNIWLTPQSQQTRRPQPRGENEVSNSASKWKEDYSFLGCSY